MLLLLVLIELPLLELLLELLVLAELVEIELPLLAELELKSSTPSRRGCPLWAKSLRLTNKLLGRRAAPSNVSTNRISKRRASGSTSSTTSSVPATLVVVMKSGGLESTAQTVTTRESRAASPLPR